MAYEAPSGAFSEALVDDCHMITGVSGQRTLSLERAIGAVISVPCFLKVALLFSFRNFSSLTHVALWSMNHLASPFPGQRNQGLGQARPIGVPQPRP